MVEKLSDIAYLDTMNSVLVLALEFIDDARSSEGDARMGINLRMASRALRCAMELYADRLAQIRAEAEQEKAEKE